MRQLPFNLNTIGLLLIPALFAACSVQERQFGSGGGAGGAGGMGGMSSTSSGAACSNDTDCAAEPNATAACVQGACAYECVGGFSNCDDAIPGCEMPTSADVKNCGKCGNTCGLACVNSTCIDPVDVVAGYHHACALLSDGAVFCWGDNTLGEVGDSGLAPSIPVPIHVKLPGRAVQITAGGGMMNNQQGGHSCALMEDGTVQCWGSDAFNQLGLGVNDFNDPFPQPVVGVVNAVKVEAGGAHTCALKKSGDLLCWGRNNNGQIGTGVTSSSVQTPTSVLTNVRDMALGHEHTCAIRNTDGLYCWGNNYAGMLGTADPMTNTKPMPVQVLPPMVDQVSLGQSHTCARVGNELYCWGADYQSQTGLGNFTTVDKPTLVTVPDVRTFDVGNVFSGSVSGDAGEVRMWGYGPMGNGKNDETTPALNGLSGVFKLSLGGGYGQEGFACAILMSKQMVCWGFDAQGQVGDGPDNSDKPTPVPVVWEPLMP